LCNFYSYSEIDPVRLFKMCNVSPQEGSQTAAPANASHANSSVALSSFSPSQVSSAPDGRRRWTTGELTEILAAIGTMRTGDIAHTLGVNPKALRSLLRRNGISLRALRDRAKREEKTEGGLVVRRSALGPSATYGAAALEKLPDGACRWSLGDPAEPGFQFCGAPVDGRSPYCGKHRVQAFHRRGCNHED